MLLLLTVKLQIRQDEGLFLCKKAVIFARNKKKQKKMATITLNYDAGSLSAKKLLEAILVSGLFERAEGEQSPYNPEFVKKIKTSRLQVLNGQTRKIKTADLWK